MKTSLNLDDRVFEEAKKESYKSGRAISDIISHWASLGREVWKQNKVKTKRQFTPLDLGSLQVDLTNRKDWMDILDHDRS